MYVFIAEYLLSHLIPLFLVKGVFLRNLVCLLLMYRGLPVVGYGVSQGLVMIFSRRVAPGAKICSNYSIKAIAFTPNL